MAANTNVRRVCFRYTEASVTNIKLYGTADNLPLISTCPSIGDTVLYFHLKKVIHSTLAQS